LLLEHLVREWEHLVQVLLLEHQERLELAFRPELLVLVLHLVQVWEHLVQLVLVWGLLLEMVAQVEKTCPQG